MPKATAEIHDGYLKKYLETSVEGNVINQEKFVLC